MTISCLNKSIAGQLAEANVDKHIRGWKGASDHAPVWIKLSSVDTSLPKKSARNVITSDTQNLHAKKGERKKNIPITSLKHLLEDAPIGEIPFDIKPMKVTLVDASFDDPGRIYEIKWDGYRAVAIVK